MKRLARNAVIVGLSMALCISPLNTGMVHAENRLAETGDLLTEGGSQTRADVIVRYYRVHNGRLQYRRYNETRGYWVDPKWIDCEPGK